MRLTHFSRCVLMTVNVHKYRRGMAVPSHNPCRMLRLPCQHRGGGGVLREHLGSRRRATLWIAQRLGREGNGEEGGHCEKSRRKWSRREARRE